MTLAPATEGCIALRQLRCNTTNVRWAPTLRLWLVTLGMAANAVSANAAGAAAAAATPAVTGAVNPTAAVTARAVAIGETLPDAMLHGLNGPSRPLSVYRGKPLIINVWASWCGPCRQELASLERLAWSEGAGPFAVIGISTDDYPERAQALLAQTHATISHFIDRNLQMENLLGADRLPLTVLVDARGRVLDKIYGSRQWDDAESLQLIARRFGARAATARPAGKVTK